MSDIESRIREVIDRKSKYCFLVGDCRRLLDMFPSECADLVVTSPPYWKMRVYDVEDGYSNCLIGAEDDPKKYVGDLVAIFRKAKRVLKPSGSLWLNIGDKYHNKNLMGMPWRVALALQEDGWILRNDVIWDQMKGTQSVKDRLRTVYEHIFHFVKRRRYYYSSDEIRIKPKRSPTINNGKVVSATGVSGKKYRQQILRSRDLNNAEKMEALRALEDALSKLRSGEIVDFRMTIRGNQRTLHSDSNKVSGRARELEDKGFFIIMSHSKGYIPSDIWRVVPEDKWRKDTHYAVFPVELLKIPINATCPEGGIVLDPFVGTGSSVVAAILSGRRGIGIDISDRYIRTARERMLEAERELLSSFDFVFRNDCK